LARAAAARRAGGAGRGARNPMKKERMDGCAMTAAGAA